MTAFLDRTMIDHTVNNHHSLCTTKTADGNASIDPSAYIPHRHLLAVKGADRPRCAEVRAFRFSWQGSEQASLVTWIDCFRKLFVIEPIRPIQGQRFAEFFEQLVEVRGCLIQTLPK